MLITVFWILVSIILYSYLGYTLVLLSISIFKREEKLHTADITDWPEVTLLVAAYNENQIIDEKIANSFQLDYPNEKIKYLWITDGSNDGSNLKLKTIPGIEVLHIDERKGKTAALNRAMQFINTPFTIFTDANSILAAGTIKELVSCFADPKVGCVAGEKRVVTKDKDKAVSAGEGIYWSYESFLKSLESRVGTTIGAAGEIYAIRTFLFLPPAENIILDDFVVSLTIALNGYKIKYKPDATAKEFASYNIEEEIKRKTRIAAGSFQVLFNFLSLLNFFKHFTLSFQYFSHKVLRWLFVPFAFFALPIVTLFILILNGPLLFYEISFMFMLVFYFLATLGAILQDKLLKFKFIFTPFYLVIMNYSLINGLIRNLRGNQKAAWEKADRVMGV